MKHFLVVLAILASMVIVNIGAPAASAGTCDTTLTPGEDLAGGANCAGSTVFTIKDGSYKLSGSYRRQ